MTKHLKIYLEGSGFNKEDFIRCEIEGENCSCMATEIHHIDARGMGGDPQGKKDVFENLMAVCRCCHEEYEGNKDFKPLLRKIHKLKFPHYFENK